jgi:mRNA-degrading endonuclease toxin of MazEF toxin-antitoxin module
VVQDETPRQQDCLRDAFVKAGIHPHIEPGDIWKAKDSAISLIDSLVRTRHEQRYCLVLTNKVLCSDTKWPIVLIVPLSHKIAPLAQTDLLIDSTDKNGLAVKSRLILSHIQPILKKDLKEKVGEIDITKWDQVIRRVFWHIDRA